MDKKAILIIGAYPPPYGGISVHIKRLFDLLKERYNIKIIDFSVNNIEKKKNNGVHNIRKPENIIKILFNKSDLVHIHISSKHLLIGLFISFYYRIWNKKVLVTYHSLRYNIESINGLKVSIYKFLFRHINRHIAVSEEIKKKLMSFDVEEDRIEVLPGFVPPQIKKEDIDNIPNDVYDFIKNHSPLISANAYKIVKYNEEDLYGIDLLLSLVKRLRTEFDKIGLVISVPNLDIDDEYYQLLKIFIKNNDLNGNIIIYSKQCEFYPILRDSTIFIRPTNTDGDSISIREALFFEVPVISSDVVERPKGTFLFRNRDIDDLERITIETLRNNIKKSKMTGTDPMKSKYQNHLDIFRRIYEK
jgi:glycosyltransferase involved in cell wall biosynthesis